MAVWIGTLNGDFYDGTAEADQLNGKAGNDRIRGFGGDDAIAGENGHDTLEGGGGNDTLNGGTGDDSLSGGAGDDMLIGADGSDTLFSGDGGDTLDGGDGDDVLHVDGPGSKSVSGGWGTDTFVADLSWASAGAVFGPGFASRGGSLRIIDNGETTLSVLLPRVQWEEGASLPITDGIERAHVIGGSGNDTLSGFAWNDELHGNGGDDSIAGFFGDDTLTGGGGNDRLGNIYNFSATGIDRSGLDRILGGTGNDTVSMVHTIATGGDQESADGGAGLDHLVLAIAGDAHRDIAFRSGQDLVLEDGMTARNFENFSLISHGGNDTLRLSALDAGAYEWRAGEGNDRLVLDLRGMQGEARFGYRNETLSGQWNRDGGTTTMAFTSIERVSITGNGEANMLLGLDGRDTLKGGGGNDTLLGGGGRDKLLGGGGFDRLQGGDGRDKLKGGSRNDSLEGGSGSDRLAGGSGSDTLDGGTGNDRLTGGRGDDVFLFHGETGGDVITDFRAGSDKLSLLGYGGFEELNFAERNGAVEITSDDGLLDITVLNMTVDTLYDAGNFL